MTLKKTFFKLMNNPIFGKTMENVIQCKNINLVTTNRRKTYLVPEPHFHTRKWLSQNLLEIKMKTMKVKMNKPLFLGLSKLEISKTLIYELFYD